MKQLLPLAAAGLVLAACGGVPGNSVATVDGEPIAKTDYDHWNTVVRKLSPGIKPDDARNQALQVLVSFRWVDGEAERLGVKVSDADVRKSFAEQKQQAFPKEADYQKFLKDTTQTEADIVARVRVDLLGQKIQEQVVKGNDKVSDKAIADFYAKNKTRFAQPEKRDLRVVLTKGKREADKAHAALERGDAWTKVAKRYSIDDTSKATGGKLPAQAKGTLDADLDKAVFSAAKGELAGPVKTQYGYYVFTVTQRRRALAADARGGQGDDQADARLREPAEGAHRLHHGVHQALAREDRMRRGLQDVRLLERAESDPDTDAAYAITYGCMSPREWNAASYDRMSDPQLAMARDVMDRLDLRGDERVLDAGCGTRPRHRGAPRTRPERHADRGRRQPGDGRPDARAAR